MKQFIQVLVSWGPLGVFVLAFVESLGIPNPSGTDALLLLVAIKRPDAAMLCAALATGGSMLGSIVFYELMRKGGDKFLLRYTLSGRGKRFREWAQRYGMVTVFISALIPIPILPLKVFAACVCAMGVTRTRFLLVLLAARIPRYAGLAYLGVQLGVNSTAWIKGHYWQMGAFAAALFGVLYALLKWNDRTRSIGGLQYRCRTRVNPLLDSFGRVHDNLRISVTDRCNIRCFYCMPEEGVKFEKRENILTFEEIERFVRVAVTMGIRKLRVTGGEPLVRKGLPELIRKLVAIPGIQDLALTTNGVLLTQHAADLYDAGLRRINVHLDTLDRERFKHITRRDDLDKVLEGIELCRKLGYGPIKINAVAVKNLVEPDIVELARYGRERDIEIRYIEFMPLDAQGIWERDRVLTMDTMIGMLQREIGPLEEIPDADPRAPATEYRFKDGIGRVGFIASVSKPFCLNCNRVRLTSDGKLRYCLFAIEETDVKALLRSNAPDAEIVAAVRSCVADKWIGHEINTQKFVPPPRPMYSIGG